jgi:hypothetical protein
METVATLRADNSPGNPFLSTDLVVDCLTNSLIYTVCFVWVDEFEAFCQDMLSGNRP